MCENRYAIYAKREDEEYWTDWCQVSDLPRALEHAESIRRLGFMAKINDRHEKKVILKDD
jgi:hypothetical protein